MSRSAQEGLAPRNFLDWKFGSGFSHNDTITQLQDSLAELQNYRRLKTNELKCIRYDKIRLEVNLAPGEADASTNRMNSLINLLRSCGFAVSEMKYQSNVPSTVPLRLLVTGSK